MPKQATYRRLASSNWQIAEARSLIYRRGGYSNWLTDQGADTPRGCCG